MTLIELLISLSIIALLVALAMPMFSVYQRRASLNTDAEAIAQLIEYARTLHNNPDQARYSTSSGVYTVRVSNGASDAPLVELYSLADPATVIDSIRLSKFETVIPKDYSFSFGPDITPDEKLINCNGTGSSCPDTIEISVKVKNTDLVKIITIHSTTMDQKFSIKITNG